MPRPSPATTRSVIALLAIAAIMGVSVWLRWPGFVQGGFASHDVAGILYNAMVTERGGLPYGGVGVGEGALGAWARADLATSPTWAALQLAGSQYWLQQWLSIAGSN